MHAFMKNFWKWLRHYVSPAFLVLLVASFILWYLSKLSYTYVTEQPVHLLINDQPVDVVCVIEGQGSTLFGHRVHADRTLHIPLEELRCRPVHEEGHEGKWRIDPQTLQQAIAVRYNDVKILSVGVVPEIDAPNGL